MVISRRDRVREYAGDPRVRVGEVGGDEQYDNDRGRWPVGKQVRAEAMYAIIAVDGTVRRVYTTRTEARLKIGTGIAGFYNTHRLHSVCGYQSPIDYERDHQADPTVELAA
ncbi:hypothetical protein ACFVYD_34525 [Streptomyces sp. NPDC058301]|uniref:hypothetical protein n=1 Tax=Streptomyces sp. NPDC058301 TaxID=3346436 RepID=UPI0036EA4063